MHSKEKKTHRQRGEQEGRGQDYSAFSVVDITEMPWKQVAKYHSNTISPLLLPTIIHQVASAYNNATVLIESNGPGAEVCNILHYDLEYENSINELNAKNIEHEIIGEVINKELNGEKVLISGINL